MNNISIKGYYALLFFKKAIINSKIIYSFFLFISISNCLLAMTDSDVEDTGKSEWIMSEKEMVSVTINQQSLTINGKVTDDNGDPLPGVNILVKGTTSGTNTDVNGDYNIVVSNSNAVLIFTYIGFLTQEVSVTGRQNINVMLNEDVMQMEEVVVVGYGTQMKVNLTGSVAVVTASELINKPVATVSQALAGLSSGLSVVQSSGRPGTSATVRIRGTGTFSSAGTAPLVLID